MINKTVPQSIRKLLEEHKQGHLLTFWHSINPLQKDDLLAQIQQLDFTQINNWLEKLVINIPSIDLPVNLAPPPFYPPSPVNNQQKNKYVQAQKLGTELISTGKVAALVVAGGQGSRLGFDGPKGDLPISPVKGKTLFQLFAETITAASERFGTICPWYIMTSPLNYQQTIDIFRSHNYYGLEKENVFIFQQGTLPNFSFDGKILLADKSHIACSPDGHGGILKALIRSGALENIKKHGIEYLSYFQVDNPLVTIFDPLFIGLHALDAAQMSSKAVAKKGPEEKVGVFCLLDGKLTVIEYSDLPPEKAQQRKDNGSLVFELGNIAVHIISTCFIERLSDRKLSLPIHRAVKKIPHIDEKGNQIEPDKPNGIKLESFIFDALPMASKSIILQTTRKEQFSPVKNAAGTDSIDTAKQMLTDRAACWLESAGIAVPRKPDGSPDCTIEIAPAFALEKDDIKAKLSRIPKINPNDKLYLA
ncbi:MAG: UDPGP type 1 family protein [Sedimentisphaerales bacterium]|nr:UDPGP type 1 family protein [Sedimentisphaerales bacterium]